LRKEIIAGLKKGKNEKGLVDFGSGVGMRSTPPMYELIASGAPIKTTNVRAPQKLWTLKGGKKKRR